MSPANFILDPLKTAEIIKRATLTAHVVIGTYERPNGDIDTVIDIVEAPLCKPPFAEDTLGGFNAVRVVKAAIFPATLFLDLKKEARAGYAGAFRAYQMWSRARAVGKDAGDMVPHVDYDPIYLDLEHRRWLSAGGVHYTGD